MILFELEESDQPTVDLEAVAEVAEHQEGEEATQRVEAAIQLEVAAFREWEVPKPILAGKAVVEYLAADQE